MFIWLIVNTRAFYYTPPEGKAEANANKEAIDPDDCLALVPLADCFNHADVGCEENFSSAGYKIRVADHPVEKGEEIYVSYGNHSNDFLLVEYAFLPAENRWDEIALDEILLPLFSEPEKRILKKADFLGDFKLDRQTTTCCHRTQVAMRLISSMTQRMWKRRLAKGFESEFEDDAYQWQVNRVLLRALTEYSSVVQERLQQIAALNDGLPSQRDTLSRRWEQISELLAAGSSGILDWYDRHRLPSPTRLSHSLKAKRLAL